MTEIEFCAISIEMLNINAALNTSKEYVTMTDYVILITTSLKIKQSQSIKNPERKWTMDHLSKIDHSCYAFYLINIF